MANLSVLLGVFVLAGFGLVYGWILHSAVDRSVYKVTGIRALDSYFLSWLFGLLAAFTPGLFYIAFGFNEFASTLEGGKLTQRLHWAGRLQVLLLALYALVVLATVPQI